jgi:hypothetical protein
VFALVSNNFLYPANAYGVAGVIFLALVGSAELGYWLGKRKRTAAGEGTKSHLDAVQAAVFAVLGLILAFTFSMALSRFEDRKAALVDEVNTIGTAYLRTSLIPEPERTASAALFRQYVAARLALARPDWYLPSSAALRDQVSSLQDRLWVQATAASNADTHSVATGLYVSALNEAIDSQGVRDAGLRNHIPETVIYMVMIVSAIAVGILGYESGLRGGRSMVGTIITCFLIAFLVFFIMDLDRPYRGLINVNQQIMVDLQQSMQQDAPAP